MGHLGAMLSDLGVMLGDLGAMLGPGWASLGPCWAHVGPSWGHLGLMLGRLGPSWSHVGPMLGHLGAILGRCWPYVGAGLPLSEPYLDPGSPHLGRCWPSVDSKAVKDVQVSVPDLVLRPKTMKNPRFLHVAKMKPGDGEGHKTL